MEYFADKVFAGNMCRYCARRNFACKPILIRFFIFNRRPIFALTVFLILADCAACFYD